MTQQTVVVTGGAGFIGSALVRRLVTQGYQVVNLDKLTYAGNLSSVASVAAAANYHFEQVDICDRSRIRRVFSDYRPDLVMNLAAESHVDRSIDRADDFIQTNILGVFVLLEEALAYWRQLPDQKRRQFRFHQVSTDEVYGSLGEEGLFSEQTAYDPSSPYSASKASSDHLVRAWHRTYGLPVLITNCSNNYGPYQFPEKLIPHMVLCALQGKPLPVYGKGENVRDWLHVEDHVSALLQVAAHGRVGETYNIGGHNERSNLQVVNAICDLLDELLPDSAHRPHRELIEYVTDRPGHDLRYAIDAGKLEAELGWVPAETFESGLYKTVQWYLDNRPWWEAILNGSYQHQRAGLGRLAR